MAQPAPVPLAVKRPVLRSVRIDARFDRLLLSQSGHVGPRRGATVTLSLLLHAASITALLLVPLLWEELLPTPGEGLRAFFVSPAEVVLPPPPPPPPAAAGVRTRAPAAPRPQPTNRLTAPAEVPERIAPDEGIDLGVVGGVAGGVEGGVPGGVVGGIVGGLPAEAPPPPPMAVRVGGAITAPRLVHRVEPVYPPLAEQARISGFVILEAEVGIDGRVRSLKILRGMTLLDDAALAAVRQWRYQPLLLNGQPVPFVLTVMVKFNLTGAPPSAGR